MIATIIEGLDLAVSEVLTVAQRNGLAELVPDVGPAVHNGTDWTPIANDNAGTFSYWRVNGQIREQAEESTTTCANVFTAVYPLRYVAMVDRDECGNVEKVRAAATAIRGTERYLRASLVANLVEVRSVSVNVDSAAVARQEGLPPIDPNKALVTIDIQLAVTGRASCFDPCENGGSFLCRLIEAQTWAKIKACMTDGQIEAATDDLCDGGGGSVIITSTDSLTQLPPVDCGETFALPQTHIFFLDEDNQPGGVILGLDTVIEEEDGHLYPDIVVPANFIRNTEGNPANSFRATLEELINDNLPIAQDGTVTFEGAALISVPSFGTRDIDCSTTLDAAYVEGPDGHSHDGVYALTGNTVNGKAEYELTGEDRVIYYDGTQWVQERTTGNPHTHAAAPGNETYPWEADWSGEGMTVTQATIKQCCADCPPSCTVDVVVSVDSVEVDTLDDLDPCEAQTININIAYS